MISVGIDVSKGKSTVCILKPGGKALKGKCGKEAMIAGLNKFLRVYYGSVSELYRTMDEQLIS